jgi:acyl-CoA synthetase (AMP-forming)/AMP-acid ligase II
VAIVYFILIQKYENNILNYSKICQVFGVADERMGEELAVWIRLAHGSQLTEEQFRTFCKGKVNNKSSRYSIYFIAEQKPK